MASPFAGNGLRHPVLSPDGRQLAVNAVAEGRGGWQLQIMNVDGSDPRVMGPPWIAGVRATPIAFGNAAQCLRVPGAEGCQNGPFNERIGALVGSAFDIRSTILRTMVGPTFWAASAAGRWG